MARYADPDNARFKKLKGRWVDDELDGAGNHLLAARRWPARLVLAN